jgi:DNA-binding transcriptional ArsR family regulator
VGLIEQRAATTDEVLRAIAEPNRRAILQLVANEEMAAGDIAGHFPVTRPAISQHLAVLLAAGLVSERRVGTKRLFRARPEGLDDLRAFLAEMWPTALGRFKAAAEAGASVGSPSVGRRAGGPNPGIEGQGTER